jgi:glycosyltransferase involved in cell wall biosynthesis
LIDARMNISVVVPFFNVEPYIEQCCQALLAQTYPNALYEIIMVDNNSTDRSAEIVRRHPEILLLSEPRQGSYAARNRGIAHARGSVIAFIDADCVARSDWLEQIADAMSDAGIQVIQGCRRAARESWSLSVLTDYEAEREAFVFASAVPELYYGSTGNMAVRRSVFDRVGLFPEVLRGGDTMFVRRVVEAYSCSADRFRYDMHVSHIEVETSWAWFRKRYIYGRSSRAYRNQMAVRPLNLSERLRVFQATIRRGRYSVARSASLLLLLALGVLYYEAGRRFPGGTPVEVKSF